MAIPDVPAGVIITSKRHANVKENVKKGYKASANNKLKSAPVKLNIIGVPVKMPDGAYIKINRESGFDRAMDYGTPKRNIDNNTPRKDIEPNNMRRKVDDEIPLMGAGNSNIRSPNEIVLEKNI